MGLVLCQYITMQLYAGETHTEKLKRVREELKKKEAKSMVVNLLDEIAWLYNLRGSDIDYNPGAYCPSMCMRPRHTDPWNCIVFFAYSLIDADKALLFVNESQIDDAVRQHLGSEVAIHPYDTFFSYLTHLGAEVNANKDYVRAQPPSNSPVLTQSTSPPRLNDRRKYS